MNPITLRLRKREDRRIRAGHAWIFSNEIDTSATPLKGLESGAPVIIENAGGQFLAHAYVNPHSLIAARVTSRQRNRPFDENTLTQRMQQALQLREERFEQPYYRMVYSEGDFLPGLTIDRYNDVFVVQITTAGMENHRHTIVQALQQLCQVQAVYLRNDSKLRELEQLPLYREWALGEPVETLQVRENGLRFEVPAELSQKTGWFYDHRESRQALSHWVRGKRVLDVYSYVGGFGITAAHFGASEVMLLDASQKALDAAQHNAELNGFASVVSTRAGDAVETLKALHEDGQRFDVVILDPPAFIKRRKDREAGLRHYGLNNRLAMRLLSPDGVIVSASCSQALSHEDLLQQMRRAMPRDALGLQVLAPLQQAPDHPINIAMPETAYLSGVIARVASPSI